MGLNFTVYFQCKNQLDRGINDDIQWCIRWWIVWWFLVNFWKQIVCLWGQNSCNWGIWTHILCLSPSEIKTRVEIYLGYDHGAGWGVGGGLKRIKKTPARADGRDASRWYGRLRVQKLTLLVFNDVKSPEGSFHNRHFLDQLAPPPPIIVDNCPHMHKTGFFPNCYLLSVTDGSIWLPYLAHIRRIQETQFSGSKMQVHVHLKNSFPGWIGNQWIINRWITFGYNLWFASHTSAGYTFGENAHPKLTLFFLFSWVDT